MIEEIGQRRSVLTPPLILIDLEGASTPAILVAAIYVYLILGSIYA